MFIKWVMILFGIWKFRCDLMCGCMLFENFVVLVFCLLVMVMVCMGCILGVLGVFLLYLVSSVVLINKVVDVVIGNECLCG